MITKTISKEGTSTPITLGYNLKCSEGLTIQATVEKTYDQSDWITVTGADGNTKEGTIEINVSANPGNPRTANIYLDIIGGSSGPNRCTDKFIFIDQAGEGGGGSTSCSYNIDAYTTPTCGGEFTVRWTKTEPTPTPPGPTPTVCDGEITIIASSTSIECNTTATVTVTATEVPDPDPGPTPPSGDDAENLHRGYLKTADAPANGGMVCANGACDSSYIDLKFDNQSSKNLLLGGRIAFVVNNPSTEKTLFANFRDYNSTEGGGQHWYYGKEGANPSNIVVASGTDNKVIRLPYPLTDVNGSEVLDANATFITRMDPFVPYTSVVSTGDYYLHNTELQDRCICTVDGMSLKGMGVSNVKNKTILVTITEASIRDSHYMLSNDELTAGYRKYETNYIPVTLYRWKDN